MDQDADRTLLLQELLYWEERAKRAEKTIHGYQGKVRELSQALQDCAERSNGLIGFFEQSKNFMRLRLLSLVATAAHDLVADFRAGRDASDSVVTLALRLDALRAKPFPPTPPSQTPPPKIAG